VAQQGGVTKKIKNVSPRHQELESHEKKQVNLWKEGGSFQCHFQDSSPKIIRLLLNMISTRAEIILYKSDVNMRRSCVKIPKVAFGKKKKNVGRGCMKYETFDFQKVAVEMVHSGAVATPGFLYYIYIHI